LILKVEGITKSFGAQRPALSDVSFELHSGEVLCLVGENGAGKSTLIKILSGAETPDFGTILLNSKETHGLTPRDAIASGVATIYQDVELIDLLSVADNIFLGPEMQSAYGLGVDRLAQEKESKRYLDLLHIDIRPSVLVESLSAAQKQNLQIVKALHQDARILIMDEPTSSLGFEETRSLMSLVGELRSRGMAIIYISHYLEEIFEIGDTILILKDGERVGLYPRLAVDVDFVIHSMVGRDASLFFQRESVPVGDVRVIVKEMTWDEVVKKVSFEVRAGEVFGIGGLVGSGRSELVGLIYGMYKRSSGEVIIDGRKIPRGNPSSAIQSGIRLITEDRKKYAMFGQRSVAENITITHNELTGGALLNKKQEAVLTTTLIDQLHIAVASHAQSIESLSGGNQQKAIIARWMLDDADLYIFDEPTKGVDIGAKEEIYKVIVELARRGKCILMVSSDMPELLSMSDRIGVMRAGEMVKILVKDQSVDEHLLIKEFVGS